MPDFTLSGGNCVLRRAVSLSTTPWGESGARICFCSRSFRTWWDPSQRQVRGFLPSSWSSLELSSLLSMMCVCVCGGHMQFLITCKVSIGCKVSIKLLALSGSRREGDEPRSGKNARGAGTSAHGPRPRRCEELALLRSGPRGRHAGGVGPHARGAAGRAARDELGAGA